MLPFREKSKRSRTRILKKRRRLNLTAKDTPTSSTSDDSSSSSDISDSDDDVDGHTNVYEDMCRNTQSSNSDDLPVCYDNEEYFDVSDDNTSIEDTDVESTDSEDGGGFSESDISSESETENESSEFSETDETSKEPLYPGAAITVAESVVMILEFFLRHCLTICALADLLRLIAMHCVQPNKCIKSVYFFRKWLSSTSDAPLVRHFYCSDCFKKLSNATDNCPDCENSSTSYFIEIPLEWQLQEMFNRPEFYNSLNYRFERRKENQENLEDIYDGRVYKRYCNDDFVNLSSRSNISFMWNSDGVSLFKSSKFSIWPVFFKINELPPTERNKPCNMLMAGLWFGAKKPHPNLFMDSICTAFHELYHGISFDVYDLHKKVEVRGVIICGTCDLPAKAIFLNMLQYNGKFGCHKCLIRTEKLKKRTIYRKTKNLQLRTSEQTKRYAREAYERKKPVYGVKGPSVLSTLVEDPIRNTAIDPMHLLAGIIKLLLNIWFAIDYRHHAASLIKFKKIIDARLCSITPPSYIERMPRTLNDLKFWKASELIMWLLIYSIPILDGVMSEEYFDHHLKLVLGIFLLYQKSASDSDIDTASQLLQSYVANVERLYGPECLTCNVHSLLHLCEIVRDYGPLYVFSCFPFESANGKLKSLLHATRDAQIQICTGVSLYLRLDNIKKQFLRPQSDAFEFCKYLETKGIHRRKLFYINDGIAIVGSVKILKDIPSLISNTLIEAGLLGNSIHEFKCLFKDGKVYAAQSYIRSRRTNSTCVEFIENDNKYLGFIKYFLRISNCGCKNSLCQLCVNTTKTVAIISKCNSSNSTKTKNPRFIAKFIHKLELNSPESLSVIDVSSIKTMYFFIKFPRANDMYAIEPIVL